MQTDHEGPASNENIFSGRIISLTHAYIFVSGYMVKYNLLPSGVPSGTPSCKGLFFTVYPLSRPNTDTV